MILHKAHIRLILEKKAMNQIQIIIILLFSNKLQAYHKKCVSLCVLDFVFTCYKGTFLMTITQQKRKGLCEKVLYVVDR